MKKLVLMAAIAAFSGVKVEAQSLDLPRPSPNASVMQMVGLTRVDIEYSSPAVKGRNIWGDLVPYDKVWRTGANAATAISFSTDVNIAGKTVKAGKYGLFTIPGKDEWTIIINSNDNQWGSYSYKEDLDVLRFKAKPQSGEMKEHLQFTINPISDSKGQIVLQWEKVKVNFDFENAGIELSKKNIEGFMEKSKGMWSSYASAANFYVDNNLDLNKAQEWAAQSINMKEHFYNRYTMARVLNAKGEHKEAAKYAAEAKKIGESVNDDYYKAYKERVEKLYTETASAANSKKK